MRVSLIASTLAFAASVVAIPSQSWSAWGPGGKGGKCLSNDTVNALVDGYTYLLEKPGGPDFNATLNAILSDKFVVWSDSINTLSQRPLNTPAYPSKQAFLLGQAQTPPLPTVTTLEIYYTCNKITWRWVASGVGSSQFDIKGIISFNVDVAAKLIDTVYSEFNSAAFQADLGFPECQQQQ